MKKLSTLVLVLLVASLCFANTPIKSFEEEYYDYLVLTGRAQRGYLNYRNLTNSDYDIKESIWTNSASTTKAFKDIDLTVYNPRLYTSYNTHQPYGQNDGSLWQGRGFNFSLSTGFTASYKGFELTFKPELDFSQNKEYKTMHDTYGYFWGTLDLVQRYGDKPVFEFNLGDTSLRYTGKYVTALLGTEYAWLGPTYLNSILLSNNAPSYPKIEVSLLPIDVVIPWINYNAGRVELNASLGILEDSDYYKYPNKKDTITMVEFAYQPTFIETLTFGANYVVLTDYSVDSFFDMVKGVFKHKNGDEDGKLSFTIDWLIPSVGLEFYAELAKDDYSYYNFYHTRVFQAGIKKSVSVFERWGVYLELIGELGNMEMSRDALSQWPYNFYTHNDISYSNKGQLLGAGTGYAGVSYFLKANAFYKKGMTSFFAQMQHPDNNYTYWRLIDEYHSNTGNWDRNHDSFQKFKRTLDFCLSSTYFLNKSLTLEASMVGEVVVNNFYREDLPEDYDHSFKFTPNFQFSLGLTYNI